MNWDDVAELFAFDGSLREVYDLGADLATWQRFYDWVRSEYAPTLYINSEPVYLTGDVKEFFGREDEFSVGFAFRAGALDIYCFVFEPNSIGCNIDPRQVNGGAALAHLTDFLRGFGAVVGRPIFLCDEISDPEDARRYALIVYDPVRDAFMWRERDTEKDEVLPRT